MANYYKTLKQTVFVCRSNFFSVNLLHRPRLAAGVHDKPAIHELVESVPHDVKIEQGWVGRTSCTILRLSTE